MRTNLEYLTNLIEQDIDQWNEFISDAHYGYMCHKENGSGFGEAERDRRITEANDYIKMANELKLKLPTIL